MRNNARWAALNALERCRRDGTWSSQALDSALLCMNLEDRDASLASRLFFGVLQNESYLDHYIDLYCRAKLEPRVRQILRIGAYQLLLLDKIPSHAAVSETVELCRDGKTDRAASLVNAVLRRLSASGNDLPPIPGEGSAAYLSTRYSHPLWFAEKLVRDYGYSFTEAFFQSNNGVAPLCIQINRQRIQPEAYQRTLDRLEIPYQSFPELPGCIELPGGKISDLPGFAEGLFYVQDRAARAAVQAAGIQPGMKVLDACAAPGGKSFAAALDAEGRCSIHSCDLHEKKLLLLRENAERLGLAACMETEAADARVFHPDWKSFFDVVLADVPCSGLGVIRKRPEIRRKSPDDLKDLPRIQASILDTVCRYVKPAGVLLYSTCTILSEENRDHVDAFLRHHEEFYAEDFSFGNLSSSGGCFDFWPHIHGTDGFFAAKLRRKPL